MIPGNSLLRIILVFIVFITSLGGCPSLDDTGPRSGIQEVLDSLVAENGLPGINLSIISSMNRQENYSSGYADVELRTELNAGHVLFSGSVGKTYAVAVVMQLVDEG